MKGATKNKIGELNVNVSVGSTQISPSDIIVLEAGGGVCVKQERIGEVLQASEARFEKEARLRERLEAGEISYEVHRLRELVEKNQRKT